MPLFSIKAHALFAVLACVSVSFCDSAQAKEGLLAQKNQRTSTQVFSPLVVLPEYDQYVVSVVALTEQAPQKAVVQILNASGRVLKQHSAELTKRSPLIVRIDQSELGFSDNSAVRAEVHFGPTSLTHCPVMVSEQTTNGGTDARSANGCGLDPCNPELPSGSSSRGGVYLSCTDHLILQKPASD